MRLADRIVDILYCLQAEEADLGVTEIARQVGLPKSTTYRLLQALEKRWLVMQDVPTQRYSLGLGLVAMASSVLQRRGLLSAAAQGPMERLRNLSGETACLHVPSGLERVCIRQVESLNPVRYSIEVGKPWPLYCGAAGKLLLAYMPDRVVDQVIEVTGLAPRTPNTITDPALLKQELAQIRAQGYAVSFEETTPMGSAVAVPVRDPSGRVVACVSLFGVLMRLRRQEIAELLPDITATASEISQVL